MTWKIKWNYAPYHKQRALSLPRGEGLEAAVPRHTSSVKLPQVPWCHWVQGTAFSQWTSTKVMRYLWVSRPKPASLPIQHGSSRSQRKWLTCVPWSYVLVLLIHLYLYPFSHVTSEFHTDCYSILISKDLIHSNKASLRGNSSAGCERNIQQHLATSRNSWEFYFVPLRFLPKTWALLVPGILAWFWDLGIVFETHGKHTEGRQKLHQRS